MNENKWKILTSEYVISDRWIRIRKDRCKTPKGRIIEEYYVKEGDDSTLIFCLTEKGEVFLEKQYRHGIGKDSLCLPGGKIDKSDANSLEAVKRELYEECGYNVEELQFVGRLAKAPANSNEHFDIFFAANAKKIGKQNLDTGEDIELLFVPVSELLSQIREGKINCTFCVAAIYLVVDKYNLYRLSQ